MNKQRITLIHHKDKSKSCKYGFQVVVDKNISSVSYPEIKDDELTELYDINTTPKRVQEILNSLTNL